MTDIVERLRDAADQNSATPIGDIWNLAEEAADEIERLRDALKKRDETILMFRQTLHTCADELEASYRDGFEGVWTEEDFKRRLSPYRNFLTYAHLSNTKDGK